VTDDAVIHLGDLATIGLYIDDKQINRISYRELPAAEVSYRVRASALKQQDLPE
jgi:hypothetical protein